MKNGTRGRVVWFTGLPASGKDAEYQAPTDPDLVLQTEDHTPVELLDHVMRRLEERGVV